MRKQMWFLRFLELVLKLTGLALNVRIRIRPYWPFISFTWKNRREMRAVWQEIRAIRSLV